jgi:hypothetical protein
MPTIAHKLAQTGAMSIDFVAFRYTHCCRCPHRLGTKAYRARGLTIQYFSVMIDFGYKTPVFVKPASDRFHTNNTDTPTPRFIKPHALLRKKQDQDDARC